MTNQEEIRKWIAVEFFNLRCGECGDWDKCFDTHKFCETLYDKVDKFRQNLHSQGVVIIDKDGELPYSVADSYVSPEAMETIEKAGYVVVKPLIEEKK